MAQAIDQQAVERAVAQARELAPELTGILFTLAADAETLQLLDPEAADLATTQAAQRAAAAVLATAGVRVFVQRAEAAALRDVPPEGRAAWRSPAGFLHGAAALEALGLDPRQVAPKRPGKLSGTPADRLMRAFADNQSRAFDALAEELLAAGREGVIDVAVRKTAERFGTDAAEEMVDLLLQLAAGTEAGPSGWAELVALPAALAPEAVADAAAVGDGYLAAGLLPAALEVRFLPGWRSADTLAALGPAAIRRVLADVLAGRDPADLPPAKPAALAESGFGLLLGLQTDWDLPRWEAVAAHGLPIAPEGETPAEAAYRTAFAAWQAGFIDDPAGCLPLNLVPLLEVEAEIDDFLRQATPLAAGLEEIRDALEVAQQEAPGEEIVVRPAILGDALELTLLTRAGRVLDTLRLEPDRMRGTPAETLARLGEFVALVPEGAGPV